MWLLYSFLKIKPRSQKSWHANFYWAQMLQGILKLLRIVFWLKNMKDNLLAFWEPCQIHSWSTPSMWDTCDILQNDETRVCESYYKCIVGQFLVKSCKVTWALFCLTSRDIRITVISYKVTSVWQIDLFKMTIV